MYFKLDDKKISKWMIEFYCRKNHKCRELCTDCSSLYDYVLQRNNKCPFGTNKPVCSNCLIHCYNPQMRERIKTVMRFSGPAILFRKPVTGIKYLLKKKFYKLQ